MDLVRGYLYKTREGSNIGGPRCSICPEGLNEMVHPRWSTNQAIPGVLEEKPAEIQ